MAAHAQAHGPRQANRTTHFDQATPIDQAMHIDQAMNGKPQRRDDSASRPANRGPDLHEIVARADTKQ